MQVTELITDMARAAQEASRSVASAPVAQRNDALLAIRQEIMNSRATLLAANEADLSAARHLQLDDALIDRLALNPSRLDALEEGLHRGSSQNAVGNRSGHDARAIGCYCDHFRVAAECDC